MKAFTTLLAYSLRRVSALVVAMAVLLAGFQTLLILVARSVQQSNAFDQIGALIPPFARALMGQSFTTFMSFQGIVCLGYFHLSVMGSLVAMSIALATTPASEVETGFMDLILSRALARHWVITRAIAVLICCTAVLLAMMMLGTWVGLHALAPAGSTWPQLNLILSLVANLGILVLAWGGIAMAIGSAARRRAIAGGIAGLLALATFLLDYVARAWSPAESIAWLSPFRYYSPFDLLTGAPLPIKNLVVLAGIAAGGFALAYWLFSRRDISH
jgi:ABC-2 type transport system permease protein